LAALAVAGCAATPQPTDALAAAPPPNAAFYGVAPPDAVPLGPVSVTLCDGDRATMTRRILEQAVRKGGNGVTRLTCSNKGMSMTCWRQPTCNAVAINVPPLPPPPPPPPKKKRHAKRR
jgi:hypothetical protein